MGSHILSSNTRNALVGDGGESPCLLPTVVLNQSSQDHRVLNCINDVHVAAYRLDNFKTWLSDTQPTVGQDLQTANRTCSLCHQFFGTVPAGGTAYVNCFLTVTAYRYIIIEGFADALCLTSVEVYVGKYIGR